MKRDQSRSEFFSWRAGILDWRTNIHYYRRLPCSRNEFFLILLNWKSSALEEDTGTWNLIWLSYVVFSIKIFRKVIRRSADYRMFSSFFRSRFLAIDSEFHPPSLRHNKLIIIYCENSVYFWCAQRRTWSAWPFLVELLEVNVEHALSACCRPVLRRPNPVLHVRAACSFELNYTLSFRITNVRYRDL